MHRGYCQWSDKGIIEIFLGNSQAEIKQNKNEPAKLPKKGWGKDKRCGMLRESLW